MTQISVHEVLQRDVSEGAKSQKHLEPQISKLNMQNMTFFYEQRCISTYTHQPLF